MVKVPQTKVVQTFTTEDVSDFAIMTGDYNPIHLHEGVAERSRFGKRVVHGALVNGVISAALSRLDDEVILLEENVRFEAPVYHGDMVKAKATVTEEDAELGEVVDVEAKALSADGGDERTVITGTATVLRE